MTQKQLNKRYSLEMRQLRKADFKHFNVLENSIDWQNTLGFTSWKLNRILFILKMATVRKVFMALIAVLKFIKSLTLRK